MGKGPKTYGYSDVTFEEHFSSLAAILNAGLSKSVIENAIADDPGYERLFTRTQTTYFLADFLWVRFNFSFIQAHRDLTGEQLTHFFSLVLLADGVRDYFYDVIVPDNFCSPYPSLQDAVAQMVSWIIEDLDNEQHAFIPTDNWLGELLGEDVE